MVDVTVPSLDQLATDWLDVTVLAHLPTLHNFHRTAVCAPDVLGVHFWTGAEDLFVGEGPQLLEYRSYPRLSVTLDGERVMASGCRWWAYQAQRRAHVRGLDVRTTVRMLVEEPGLLVELSVSNTGTSTRRVEVLVDGVGRAAEGADAHGAWVHSGPGHLVTMAPDGVSGSLDLVPGQRRTLRLVQVEGAGLAAAQRRARHLVDGFEEAWDEIRRVWCERWADTFTPGNGHFSGSVPVLDTDDASIRRLYYVSLLTVLVLHRTDLARASRSFVTSGERAHGTVFFWDTSMCARLLALWEPDGLRDQLRWFVACEPFGGAYVNLDTGLYAGVGAQGGRPGAWYAANHLALFRLTYDYVATTGDEAFLGELVAGRTVLEHLDGLATAWERLVPDPTSALADYGGVENLLECVPTYEHRVASLNAANVWMLRTVARLWRRAGEADRAADRERQADRVAAAVLTLYEPGEGVWSCLDGGGRRPVRHCYDFICAAQFLGEALPPSVRDEMVRFVEHELITRSWMRAQSLTDPAAARSDRPDHGPYGAFGAWPALTAGALFQLGRFAEGTDLLRRCAQALSEGVVGQAYELWGPARHQPDAPVRIAARGFCLREGVAGGAFAQTIMGGLFGFRPEVGRADPRWRPDVPRPVRGVLRHVRWAGALWEVAGGPTGVGLSRESNRGDEA